MSTGTSDHMNLEIEELTLSFGDTQVLKGVDLSIRPGEFFAFLGPSGSGKSTLLRAIAGFGPKPQGRILIGGQDVAGLPPWKRDVGMVFQNYALWPHMTVHKNVAFGLEERKVSKSEIDRRVGHALEMVGLADYAGRRPSQLSGGQQQRVALARTIVIEPKVLLLDEPLSNLDANLRVQMRRDIRALQRKLGLTTVFVTHDQEEANTTADRLAVLDQGVIQQVGSPMELYDNPANLFVARFLGSANIIGGRIERADGNLVFVSDAGLSLPLSSSRDGARFAVFRPQNVEIFEKGNAAAAGETFRVGGEVSHTEFLGTTIRYVVNVGGDMIVVDHVHRQDETIFQPGAAVDIAVDTESVLTLSA